MDQSQASGRPRFRAFGRKHLTRIPQLENLTRDQRSAISAVASVLPFRVNEYIVSELIDWCDIPNDPVFQLTFPQAGMLDRADFWRMQDLLRSGADDPTIASAAREIQVKMNPHPAGQLELNVPSVGDDVLSGSQHKYRETLLFFPAQGQTCHAFCTYCFRWAQFVGLDHHKFANNQPDTLVRYLREHPEVTDVLFTGGDPLVMSTRALRKYIEPLLDERLDHLGSIRIGTKAPSYWPFRFTTDHDADDLLRLFEQVRNSGRQLALMAHVSHPRELETPAAQNALRRIIASGAVVRCQAPLIRHVNDNPEAWATMWRAQVRLGAVPYYMFIERDTGPKHYFEVPLARAYRIFSDAYGKVSGLGRTVRGPSMSATPGKVLVDGVTTIDGERVFVLKMIQARDPDWVNRVFFAEFDSQATWLDDLRPAFGASEFYYDPPMRALKSGRWVPEWSSDPTEDGNDAMCEGA